jgi:hypothetical protein
VQQSLNQSIKDTEGTVSYSAEQKEQKTKKNLAIRQMTLLRKTKKSSFGR